MTSSLGLLTTLPPTMDTTNPLGTDCNIVLPPFSIHPVTVCQGPPPALSIPTTSNTISLANHTRALAAQWTGAPIRAIAPLPRRTHVLNANNNAPVMPASARVRGATVFGRPRRRTRPAHLDSMDSDADNEGRDGAKADQESDGDEDHGVVLGSRYYSYESITAAEGLSAWSFEELRIECYAQSFVARGTKPPPVVQPLLAIPPAFAPRVVSRNS